jgi:hypothetical protein
MEDTFEDGSIDMEFHNKTPVALTVRPIIDKWDLN